MIRNTNRQKPAGTLVLLFLGLLMAGQLYSQIGIEFGAGTNISKIRFSPHMGPYRNYTSPKMGLSTSMAFNYIISDRFTMKAETGYQLLNFHAKLSGSSAHYPMYFKGNYKLDFINFSILPRFNPKNIPEFGVVAGFNLSRQLSIRKDGKVVYLVGGAMSPFSYWDEQEVNTKTSVKEYFYFINLGLDYRFLLSEKLNFCLVLGFFGGIDTLIIDLVSQLEVITGMDFSIALLYKFN